MVNNFYSSDWKIYETLEIAKENLLYAKNRGELFLSDKRNLSSEIYTYSISETDFSRFLAYGNFEE